MNSNHPLPDIASGTQASANIPLRWVGMEAIAIPLQFPVSETDKQDKLVQVNALANVFVSLDKAEAKGIHMSRLYLILNKVLATQEFHGESLNAVLQELIASQQDLSHSAKIDLQFDWILNKPALLSNQQGFQSYPIKITRENVAGNISTEVTLTIPYSSTCPCSAALSRKALSDALDKEFVDVNIAKSELLNWIESERGSIATPHSQRSYAYIKMTTQGHELPDFNNLIPHFENTMGTPVQTAVKREDEQAFAKLNAENLMFCEDAARRLKQSLEQLSFVTDYWFKVEHQESLHAHNAVVIDFK